MNKEEINKILEAHKLWVESDGVEGKRANLQYASLRGASLRGANLQGADLQYASLQEANLRGASLRGANLQGADLQYASLQEANLRGASLRGADFRGVQMDSCISNKKEIKSLHLEKYSITYTYNRLQIGCKNYSIEKWKNFTDEEICEMDKGALEWWIEWKETIFNIIEKSPAIPTGKE